MLDSNGFCEVCLAETSWYSEEGEDLYTCYSCGQEVDSLLDLYIN